MNYEPSPEVISYQEYQKYLKNGEIDVIRYREDTEYMTICLGSEETKELTEEEKQEYHYPASSKFYVQFPNNEEFRKEMLEQGVTLVNAGEQSVALYILDHYGGAVIYAVLIGLMIYALKKNNPLGESDFAKAIISGDIDVTFDDVIGHEEIKEDLKLLVRQIKDGKNARNLSHGILFEGGAGTGKTMLAKAVAHEAGLNFISVNSSNLVEMYVGLGARRVRQAFKQARKIAPCVLFFDELDAVGAKRGSQRSHRENDQTINALLTEMDGFQTTDGVFVIAATNRAEDLDDALVRAGRFDRKVKIEAPKNWNTRKQLFDHYLADCELADDVNTEILAKQVVGFSGADISAVVRESKLISFKEEHDYITQDNLEEAIDKMVFKGNRVKDDKHHEEDVKIVAYHEAGHAIATIVTGNDVSRISIRGMTSGIGGAVFGSDNDRAFESKEDLENQIVIAYAGRASEEIFFGANKITQGASNDITQATSLLYSYVAKYGFDNNFGLVDYEILVKNGIVSEDNITNRISKISSEIYQKTLNLIMAHKKETEVLAKRLIDVKTMDGKELDELLKLQNITVGSSVLKKQKVGE